MYDECIIDRIICSKDIIERIIGIEVIIWIIAKSADSDMYECINVEINVINLEACILFFIYYIFML